MARWIRIHDRHGGCLGRSPRRTENRRCRRKRSVPASECVFNVSPGTPATGQHVVTNGSVHSRPIAAFRTGSTRSRIGIWAGTDGRGGDSWMRGLTNQPRVLGRTLSVAVILFKPTRVSEIRLICSSAGNRGSHSGSRPNSTATCGEGIRPEKQLIVRPASQLVPRRISSHRRACGGLTAAASIRSMPNDLMRY